MIFSWDFFCFVEWPKNILGLQRRNVIFSLSSTKSVHSNRPPDQSLHQLNHSLLHFSFLHHPPISLSLPRNQCCLSIRGHKTSAASVPLFNYQETHTASRASHTQTHTLNAGGLLGPGQPIFLHLINNSMSCVWVSWNPSQIHPAQW